MQKRIDKIFFKDKSIPVDLFLDKILYHKKLGYYQKKNPFGKKGDFITAPETSQLFGDILGLYIFYIWRQKYNTDFNLIELGGTEKSLNSYYGNVVLLNFWATWCGPCRLEMPALQDLHETTESTYEFRIIAVNLKEDHEIVKSFVSQLSLTFPILLDLTGEIASTYGASTLPMTYLIDKDGTILSRIIGIRDWTEQEFKDLFIELSSRDL